MGLPFTGLPFTFYYELSCLGVNRSFLYSYILYVLSYDLRSLLVIIFTLRYGSSSNFKWPSPFRSYFYWYYLLFYSMVFLFYRILCDVFCRIREFLPFLVYINPLFLECIFIIRLVLNFLSIIKLSIFNTSISFSWSVLIVFTCFFRTITIVCFFYFF